jgi:c-di-GMP-binding flagellar brake protein YcgR
MTEPHTPPAADTAEPEPRDIWKLLAELQEQKTEVSLLTMDRSVTGATYVLAFERNDNMLLLNALANPERLMTAGDTLQLEATINGFRVAFECDVIDILQLQAGKAYLGARPMLTFDETHRRVTPRLQLPADHKFEAAIVRRDMGTVPAQVVDISRMGFGAQIDTPPADMPDGTRVHCSLDLQDLKVFVSATVRHTRAADSGVRVGLQFAEVAPAIQGELNRAVTELERQLARQADNPESGEKKP